MTIITVSSKGQVVIPARIRRQLDLKRATRLQAEVQDNKLVLTPCKDEDWRSLYGAFAGSGLTAGLEQDHAREREKERRRTQKGKPSGKDRPRRRR
jgi:AbrB family looped-hinge helix DNA binding protein